jgi:hypothetical protein
VKDGTGGMIPTAGRRSGTQPTLVSIGEEKIDAVLIDR